MNLVERWCDLNRTQKLTTALDDLNVELETNYDLSRLGQWRRGDQSVPDAVQRYMRREVLEAFHVCYSGDKFSRKMYRELLEICEVATPRAKRAVLRRFDDAERAARSPGN